jgi:hypothetical protein
MLVCCGQVRVSRHFPPDEPHLVAISVSREGVHVSAFGKGSRLIISFDNGGARPYELPNFYRKWLRTYSDFTADHELVLELYRDIEKIELQIYELNRSFQT